MLIKLKQNTELVATANEMMVHLPLDNQVVQTLYFFPRISLSPPVIFVHMSGTGLMAFLDHCRLIFGEEPDKKKVEDLRYVHGRSETLKGETEVTSVLLAKLSQPISEPTWLEQVPEIYAKFLKTCK